MIAFECPWCRTLVTVEEPMPKRIACPSCGALLEAGAAPVHPAAMASRIERLS